LKTFTEWQQEKLATYHFERYGTKGDRHVDIQTYSLPKVGERRGGIILVPSGAAKGHG
jgi:hypothetical protein